VSFGSPALNSLSYFSVFLKLPVDHANHILSINTRHQPFQCEVRGRSNTSAIQCRNLKNSMVTGVVKYTKFIR
jgi:hypothetical protein